MTQRKSVRIIFAVLATMGMALTSVSLTGCGKDGGKNPKDQGQKDQVAKDQGKKPDNEAKIKEALDTLSPEDRKLAAEQKYCVEMTDHRLGSMGPPIKLTLNDKTVFVCCKACVKRAEANPDKTVEKLTVLLEETGIQEELAKLSPEDKKLVIAQKFCVVQTAERLGSMGAPVKITIKDQTVFLCCGGCKKKAEADPEKTLKALEKLKKENAPPPQSMLHWERQESVLVAARKS